ncbi:MAG: hypothetical protein AAB348_03690 [Patescibacteria group bacterium]
MLAKNNSDESWKNDIQLISQCPVCGIKYKNDSAKLYAGKKNANFVHITCHRCGSYFMAMVMNLGRGTSTVGMITDLSFLDIKRLYSRESITVDEVIEWHKLLSNSGIRNFFQ